LLAWVARRSLVFVCVGLGRAAFPGFCGVGSRRGSACRAGTAFLAAIRGGFLGFGLGFCSCFLFITRRLAGVIGHIPSGSLELKTCGRDQLRQSSAAALVF